VVVALAKTQRQRTWCVQSAKHTRRHHARAEGSAWRTPQHGHKMSICVWLWVASWGFATNTSTCAHCNIRSYPPLSLPPQLPWRAQVSQVKQPFLPPLFSFSVYFDLWRLINARDFHSTHLFVANGFLSFPVAYSEGSTSTDARAPMCPRCHYRASTCLVLFYIFSTALPPSGAPRPSCTVTHPPLSLSLFLSRVFSLSCTSEHGTHPSIIKPYPLRGRTARW
jgi:hypothetical protein